MVSCTGPPALGEKWQNRTFHPLPSSQLGTFLLKVRQKAQLDVWMRTALERILYRSVLFRRQSAFDPRRWKFGF